MKYVCFSFASVNYVIVKPKLVLSNASNATAYIMLGFQFFLSLSFAVISHDNINTIVAKEGWLPALIRCRRKTNFMKFPWLQPKTVHNI